MRSSASHAAAPPPLATPAVGLAVALPPKQDERTEPQKVDWLNLPCPVPFEEIQREALMSLKPELFKGLRFDFTKGINQKFSLSHSVFMGSMEMEVPSQSSTQSKFLLHITNLAPTFSIQRVMTDGRLNARVKCDLIDNLTLKINAQLTNEPHFSQGMFSIDYKSVSTYLSLGGEIFWLGHQRKSGIGFTARYNTDNMVATGQVASTGIVALSYLQKVSEKVSLASDFMYNHLTQDVTSSFGYDYILRPCRSRGKLDSNGVIAAFLEERLNMGVTFILSAEVNHQKKGIQISRVISSGDGITGDLELSCLAASAYNDPCLIIYGCQSLMYAEASKKERNKVDLKKCG